MIEKSTYYILDAQGQQLSMYEHIVDSTEVKYNLAERNILGSSRLGTITDGINMYNPEPLPSYGILGNRLYELSNHLNNVLTVISDKLVPLDDDQDGEVDGYQVSLEMVSDYSAFGVQLDGRTFESELNRYGFMGYEGDSEAKGNGNSYTTEFRQYDPRLGRWLSVDPLENQFPFSSPYVAFNNNPLRFIDPDGQASEDGVKPETTDNSSTDPSKPKPMKDRNFLLFTLSFRKADRAGELGSKKRSIEFRWNFTFSKESSTKPRWKTQRFTIDNMNVPFFNGTQLTANTQTYPSVAVGNATNIEGATLNNQITNIRSNEYLILSVNLKTKRNDHGGDSFYSFNIGGRNLNHQNNNRRSVIDPSTITPNSIINGAMVNQTPHRDGTFDSCDGYKLTIRVQYKTLRTRTRLKIVPRAVD